MTRRRPTIHDVAKRAGVSITTVSHALNNKGQVSEQTRSRVRAAASALGYVANPLAKGFRENRLHALGLVIRPLVSLPSHQPEGVDYFSRLAGEISSRALDYGYGVMLLGQRHNPVDYSLMLAFDGYIVCQPTRADPLVSYFRGLSVPTVTISRDLSDPDHPDSIDSMDYEEISLLLDHLYHQGARSLWFILGVADDSWNQDAHRAASDFAHSFGIDVFYYQAPEQGGSAGGRHAIEELLRRFGSLPDAVICLTGRQAAGAQHAIFANGYSVPQDTLLASCIDSVQSRSARVPITTVQDATRDTARQVVDLLLARIEGFDYERVSRKPQLELRSSTAMQ
ncbi:LacI family DNA-binding transcriptional regulator [Gulosibacter hominis]|uniref:LacI family DNA-binding transcriptional regulator n=1 Tax=Gulosibacter hominis TaxID=2770504 RepID=UPI00191A688E|nr:LacI family DNA-binding transcriptional regulator [Gulosibacter hominis]